MALTKLQQQVQQIANDIDENYVEIDQVDKDEIEIESECESECDSETTLEDDYMSEPEPVEEPDPTSPPSSVKVKRKYTKREPKVGIATSDPNIQVIMKSKKKGPNKIKKVTVKPAHETCFSMALQIYPDRERRRRLVYGYLDRLRLPAR